MSVLLKLARKKRVFDPDMQPGEIRGFSDERAAELLKEHPGWFEEVTDKAAAAEAKAAAGEVEPAFKPHAKPHEPKKK
jgi:hypothetical protein